MLYFAYGSNLDPAQMQERCPGHRVVGLAALRNHRLVFPCTSDRWGGGVASVQAAHARTVWGVLFELNEEDLKALDGYEGFVGPDFRGNRYDRRPEWVDLVRPDDGSIPRRVRAEIYVARPTRAEPPSRRYLDAILRGARHHRLPDEAIAELEALPTGDPA